VRAYASTVDVGLEKGQSFGGKRLGRAAEVGTFRSVDACYADWDL
jgi:hypothetical protein